jgi:hypothetical protein
MKNVIFIALGLVLTFNCKAQTPIVSLDSYRHRTIDGAYFKDLNNEFNKFEGNWIYTNGNTTFKIVLQKKEMVFNNTDYEDLLIGEYQYIENGNEIISTLQNLNNSNIEGRYHNISGRKILQNTNKYVTCDDCLPSERRIVLHFTDPERDYLPTSIVLRYDMASTIPEKMTVTIIATDGVVLPYEGAPEVIQLPYGEYLKEKL